jgi:hypothetical protein
MFKNFENLTCDNCSQMFMGRRPAEGGDTSCPECLAVGDLSVVDDGNKIPKSVIAEITREEPQYGK